MTDEPEPVTARLEILKARLSKALRGFESGLPEGMSDWDLTPHSPEASLFPVPELVLFGLRNMLGFQWTGPWEKVRWTVYATVEGEPFAFALQKFGFRILTRREVPQKLLARVTGQLSGSLKLLEPLLKIYAEAQIADGNLTLENRMSLYDGRYTYFRQLADQAFSFEPEIQQASSKKQHGDIKIFEALTEQMNLKADADHRGFFASGAMVDAWFSRLEHRMLLLRAFLGRPMLTGAFNTFLTSRWDDRLVALFDGEMDDKTGALLGELRDVKATIRNPLAHGGVENDGGAFYFHLPGVGAIPANLSRYRGRLRMSFVPIPASTHAQTCALFDAVDEILSTGRFQLANEFVRWGIDPQFDGESIASYGNAIAAGADAVEALVERLSHEWERHTNMDY
jgi:hypothetical protein